MSPLNRIAILLVTVPGILGLLELFSAISRHMSGVQLPK